MSTTAPSPAFSPACLKATPTGKSRCASFRRGTAGTTLWDTRRVDADQALARRVWRGIRQNISPGAGRLASRAFLTCLEEREIHIWRFLEYGFRRGSSVTADLGDDRVDVLRRAVQHLEEEAHKYTGFVRFSDQGGVLVSEIQPKNRVLPLLRVHFTQRLNTEAFVIFDRTHREGLVHQGGRWAHSAYGGLRFRPSRGPGAILSPPVAAVLPDHRHRGADQPPLSEHPPAQALPGYDDGVSAR